MVIDMSQEVYPAHKKHKENVNYYSDHGEPIPSSLENHYRQMVLKPYLVDIELLYKEVDSYDIKEFKKAQKSVTIPDNMIVTFPKSGRSFRKRLRHFLDIPILERQIRMAIFERHHPQIDVLVFEDEVAKTAYLICK